jgi:hypothetical protein
VVSDQIGSRQRWPVDFTEMWRSASEAESLVYLPILAVFLFVVAFGAWKWKGKVEAVKRGMSEAEVREALGEPTRTSPGQGDRVKWVYTRESLDENSSRTVVTFRGGKVESVRHWG